MASIETLTGVTKVSDFGYEVTGGLVQVGSGIDDIEHANFIQKDGGLLSFVSGCTTTFSRCTFNEESSAYTTTAVRYERIKSGTSPIFEGCTFKFTDMLVTNIAGNIVSGSPVVTNIVGDITLLAIGQNLVASGIPAGGNAAQIISIDIPGASATLDKNATSTKYIPTIAVRRDAVDFDVSSGATPQFNSDDRGAPCVFYRDNSGGKSIANHYYSGTFNNYYVDQNGGGGAFETMNATVVINGLYLEDRNPSNPLASRHWIVHAGNGSFHNKTTTYRAIKADNIGTWGNSNDNNVIIEIIDALGDFGRAEDTANAQRGYVRFLRTYKSVPTDPSSLNPVQVNCYLQNVDNSDIIINNASVSAVDEELLQYRYDHNTTGTKIIGGIIVEDSYKLGFIAYDRNIYYSEFDIVERLDGSPFEYTPLMIVDKQITESNKTTVDAYTTLSNNTELYDRAKAYLFDNYAGESTIYVLDNTADIGAANLTMGETESSAFAYSAGDMTIKIPSAGYSGTIKTTGTITLSSATDLSNLVIDGDLEINTPADATLAFSNVIVTGNILNTSSNTLTINAANGSSLTTTEPGTAAGEVDIQNSVEVKIIVQDVNGTKISGARVFIKRTSDGVSLYNDVTDVNGEISFLHNYTSDENITGRVRKSSSSPLYVTGVIAGTINSTGFNSTVTMVLDE